jgi:tRNA-uridine 2-sulfurtransferase
MEKKQQKVYLAMSGGVDSSVAALLLKEKGYSLTGVYMRNWHADIHDGFMGDCPWQDDWADVQAVCEKLDIPCQIWDFSQEYYDEVVSYFFSEYKAGRTPNPDVMCNRHIKFGYFMKKALAAGADYVATGHYARLGREIRNSKSETLNKPKAQNSKLQKEKINNSSLPITHYSLLTGLDANKDQSYFLWTLTQDQLSHALFPIGELEKSKVRELAKDAGLSTHDKPDSQGICFIGRINVQEFLRSRLPEKVGQVVTAEGKVLGQHKGAHFFTEGQRHGLDIGGSVLPYYVQSRDIRANLVTVVEGDDHPDLFKSELTATQINWQAGDEPQLPLKCQARIRYRQKLQPCQVEALINPSTEAKLGAGRGASTTHSNASIRVRFIKPQRAVSPGQSIVFYQRDECLGGGIIVE